MREKRFNVRGVGGQVQGSGSTTHRNLPPLSNCTTRLSYTGLANSGFFLTLIPDPRSLSRYEYREKYWTGPEISGIILEALTP